MKVLSILLFLVLLSACTTQPQPLTAEQYVYYDECVFVEEYLEIDCESYARSVDAGEQEALDEMCVFDELNCESADAHVQLTDIRITAEFDTVVESASINFNGLVRECRAANMQVMCNLPIIQVDREYKQPFTLTVDGQEGKLLVFV